jgi:uncharacterized membrane protein
MRTERGGHEDGMILVLTLGYLILCLLIASVVIGVSAAYIEHKKLLSLADGAAQAAADSFTLGEATQGPSPPAASLTTEKITASVRAYLHRVNAASRFDGFTVSGATGSEDGRSAKVTLEAVAHPPLVGIVVPEGIRIEATSIARARLTR